MGAKGIEPPCIAAPDPKSGASTNFATRPFQNIQLSNLYFGRNWSTISYASRSAQLGHLPISKYSVVKSLLRAKLVYHIVCVALCATRPLAHFKIFSCQIFTSGEIGTVLLLYSLCSYKAHVAHIYF